MKPVVAVFCPMPMEFEAVEKSIGSLGELLESGFEEKRFSLENVELILARCGVGKTFAAAKAQKVIQTYAPAHIFVCGVAGAIARNLNVFDVVVPSKIVHGDIHFGTEDCPTGVVSSALPLFQDSPAFAADGYLADRLHCPYKNGTLATLDCFAEEREKDTLEEKFGAVCIDMESAPIVQIATLWDTPFTVVRAISDNREHTFGDFATNAPKACDAAAAALMALLQDF